MKIIRSKIKIKIKYKLIFAMYLVVLPALITASSFMYVNEYKETVKSMTELYENLSYQTNLNMNYIQDDLVDLSTFVSVNDDIRYILNSKKSKIDYSHTFLWDKSAPMGFIKDIISIKNDIKTIILYPENGIAPFYQARDKSVHNMDINKVHDTAIYHKALKANGDNVWSRVEEKDTELFINNKTDKIVISRVLFDWSKKRRLGYLAIGVNVDKYVQMCNDLLLNENEGIVICNYNGEELVRTGLVDNAVLSYIKSETFLNLEPQKKQLYFEYNGHYVFCNQTDEDSNFVCYMVPKENWLSKIENTKTIPIAFSIILFFALWPLSMFASTIISKPLQRLYHSMIKFKDGDFEQQIIVAGNDEIGEVTECFNHMVKDIKELIDSNYVMVLKERQSELDALQAQINPHFLYNTLDSLYWQALGTGSEKLAEDILSLSQLFRLVLSKGEGMIPVSKEKELIFHYLQIQKMRFEKKLNYVIEIENEILSYLIPKLILQPFVENAIVHGLERTDKLGMIEIKGYEDNEYIIFQVTDNGVGMSKEELDELNFEQETKEYSCQRIGGYAIKNVRERLELKYHDEFRLLIQSKIGKGTTIIIQIPKEASNYNSNW